MESIVCIVLYSTEMRDHEVMTTSDKYKREASGPIYFLYNQKIRRNTPTGIEGPSKE